MGLYVTGCAILIGVAATPAKEILKVMRPCWCFFVYDRSFAGAAPFTVSMPPDWMQG